MAIAKQELQAIASEILLALGGQFDVAAHAVSAHANWWDHLPKGPDPQRFDDADEYFRAAVAGGLFKKFEDFPGDEAEKKSKAFEKWVTAEKQCFRTNRRFDDYLREGERFVELPTRVRDFLLDLKKEISFVLGRCPNHLNASRFGPGTTFDLRGKLWSSIPSKISVLPTMTQDAWPHIRLWADTMWGRYHCGDLFPSLQDYSRYRTLGMTLPKNGASLDMPVVRGNRYETVPKNRETDRSIGIEPSLNLYYQLGVGDYLKGRLRRCGYLLKPKEVFFDIKRGVDSQELHREFARLGSIAGHIATLDLSSASDTVASALVEYLLPPRWFELLASLRSPYTLVKGRWYRLEKFSSMGNGYTFELETLIFVCACRVIVREKGGTLQDVSCYGDDIIVPTNCADDVAAALRFLGFTINPTKSFTSGPFRESCGGDFFGGVDVRPPSISGEPRGPADWFVVHNQLTRLRGRVSDFHLNRALSICVRNIPVAYRCFGPSYYGDAVLHADPTKWDTAMRQYSCALTRAQRKASAITRGSPVMSVRVLLPQPGKLPWERFDEHLAACSGVYGLPSDGVPLRDSVNGFRIGWLPVL